MNFGHQQTFLGHGHRADHHQVHLHLRIQTNRLTEVFYTLPQIHSTESYYQQVLEVIILCKIILIMWTFTTWEEEHVRSCSLFAPWGGVILLKRPVRRRGVGTNNVFCACKHHPKITKHNSPDTWHDWKFVHNMIRHAEWLKQKIIKFRFNRWKIMPSLKWFGICKETHNKWFKCIP